MGEAHPFAGALRDFDGALEDLEHNLRATLQAIGLARAALKTWLDTVPDQPAQPS